MSTSSLSFLLLAAALSLSLTVLAGATPITVSSTEPTGYMPTTVFGIGSVATGAVASFGSRSGTANSSLDNYYSDPLLTSAYYAYAEGGGTVTLGYASGIGTFSMLWGSPDDSNEVTFSGPGGIFSYTGSELVADGLVTNSENSQFVVFTDLGAVTSIRFTSGQNSFEFGDIATGATPDTPSPEPGSAVLVASGLLLIVVGTLRRQQRCIPGKGEMKVKLVRTLSILALRSAISTLLGRSQGIVTLHK